MPPSISSKIKNAISDWWHGEPVPYEYPLIGFHTRYHWTAKLSRSLLIPIFKNWKKIAYALFLMILGAVIKVLVEKLMK